MIFIIFSTSKRKDPEEDNEDMSDQELLNSTQEMLLFELSFSPNGSRKGWKKKIEEKQRFIARLQELCDPSSSNDVGEELTSALECFI